MTKPLASKKPTKKRAQSKVKAKTAAQKKLEAMKKSMMMLASNPVESETDSESTDDELFQYDIAKNNITNNIDIEDKEDIKQEQMPRQKKKEKLVNSPNSVDSQNNGLHNDQDQYQDQAPTVEVIKVIKEYFSKLELDKEARRKELAEQREAKQKEKEKRKIEKEKQKQKEKEELKAIVQNKDIAVQQAFGTLKSRYESKIKSIGNQLY